MNSYIQTLKKYAVFEGRASRTEYWGFFFINFFITFAIVSLALATGSYSSSSFSSDSYSYSYFYLTGPLSVIHMIFCLVILLPNLAVLVRRLHDTSHSGAWFFITLVPLIGFIILLIFLLSASTPGENQYGPNPFDDNSENKNNSVADHSSANKLE